MTTPRNHKHAALIKAWLDDARLEVETNTGAGWHDDDEPWWIERDEYRFKPKMIRCGNMEFPEPIRVAPAIDTEYWVISMRSSDPWSGCTRETWCNSTIDITWLQRGICHATQAAAKQHARALVALTESKS